MSIWLDDLKRDNPAKAADIAIAGGSNSVPLRNMIKALELPISQFLNTPEDEARLAAAKRIVRNRY